MNQRKARVLLRFLVRRALVAPRTEFLVLNATGLFLAVLRRRIVASLAGRTFQRYDISHGQYSFNERLLCVVELATGIEPVTSSLPRTCSTN